MEQVIAGIIEKSLIGGAFLYMLHFFLTKFSSSLEAFGNHLHRVSETLLKMDTRMEQMDKRIEKLEERGFMND